MARQASPARSARCPSVATTRPLIARAISPGCRRARGRRRAGGRRRVRRDALPARGRPVVRRRAGRAVLRARERARLAVVTMATTVTAATSGTEESAAWRGRTGSSLTKAVRPTAANLRGGPARSPSRSKRSAFPVPLVVVSMVRGAPSTTRRQEFRCPCPPPNPRARRKRPRSRHVPSKPPRCTARAPQP